MTRTVSKTWFSKLRVSDYACITATNETVERVRMVDANNNTLSTAWYDVNLQPIPTPATGTFTLWACTNVVSWINWYTVSTNLVAWYNVITHNLNITVFDAYDIYVKDSAWNNISVQTVPAQDTANSLTIDSITNINNVRVVIIPI